MRKIIFIVTLLLATAALCLVKAEARNGTSEEKVMKAGDHHVYSDLNLVVKMDMMNDHSELAVSGIRTEHEASLFPCKKGHPAAKQGIARGPTEEERKFKILSSISRMR